MTATDRADATSVTPAATRLTAPRLPARDRTVIITLLVATFVVILNETIMGVALPRLMDDLRVPTSTVQWLSTAFLLTMGVVIPTTGFLLQRLATRTVFVLAMSLFSAGTLLAAVSPGFWMLLGARVVQASGTAIMLPLLMTTILTLVPIERRGVVMGNVSIAISVAPAIGPTVSGLILQFLSWRFMFVIVLPIALAALVLGARLIGDVGESGRQRLDLVSVLLSVPAFGGLVYGLSRLGESASGGLSVALVFLVVGVLCLLAFGWRQLRLARGGDPLLDLAAFRFPMFSLSVTMLCIAMVALFGVVILLPIYLQNVRGLDSLQTGLLLLPGGLLMGLLGPGRRPAVRPLRPQGPLHLRCRPARADALAAEHRGCHHARLAAGRLPPGALAGPGLPVHPGLHDRPQPAAALAVLPRQRDPLDAAAGRRRGRHGAARGHHVGPGGRARGHRHGGAAGAGRGSAHGLPRGHRRRARRRGLRAVPAQHQAGAGGSLTQAVNECRVVGTLVHGLCGARLPG